MDYDIEADWHLLDTCNYRCDYCFFPPARLSARLPAPVAAEAWDAAFAATGLTWLLHVTGGEPTLLPGFAALCERLSRRHLLSLNTNLSHRAVLDLATRVDPSRLRFVNAALHPAERARRDGMPAFLRHAVALLRRGFPLFVSFVATPRALAEADELRAAVAPLGLAPVPKLLRGMAGGRRYPKAYTAAERDAFRALAREARAAYAPMLARLPERPTIDAFRDASLLHGLPDFRGRICRAGRDFVSLSPRGEVTRCSTKLPLGNLLDGSFRRLAEARRCDTDYCFHFCRKYAAPAPAASPEA
jgi:MoaA/NifB/PqqE/SkfB family radical SAM enzyme